MKSIALFASCLLASSLMAQQSSISATTNSSAEPKLFPHMVSPAIDVAGEPFSYASQSTDQISMMYANAGTEITPEGFLYTGYGELMFFVGVERQPIAAHIRTLEDGYLPILHYTVHHAMVDYEFTVFAASLGERQDGRSMTNFVRVQVKNPTASLKHAFLTSAWRYQAEQQTPFATGDNRFQRPVQGKVPGDYQQPGALFRADSSYAATAQAYLQDGKALYFFPSVPSPYLRPTLHDFYNLLHLGPVGLQTSITPSTPVATAEYDVPLAAGEEKTLDFKMPLAPLSTDSAEYAAVQQASFEDRRLQVRAFWNDMLTRGLEIETPEKKVNDTFKTSLINNLMSLNKVGKDSVQTINQLHYHAFYLRDSADFVRMYDTSNYPNIGRQIVDFFATRQRPDGNFLSQEGQYDGWGQALWTYGEHYRMTHDKQFAAEVYPRVVHAVQWLESALAADPLHIMPATDVRDNEFVPGHLTGYNFLALNGLQAAELLAHDLGHADDEQHFHGIEANLRAAFLKQLEKASASHGGSIPPSLDPGAGGTDWGNLLSIVPEQQLNPFDSKVTETLRRSQAAYQEGIMTYRQEGQGAYLHHYLTIKNTLTELVRGEQEQALHELYAVLLHTSSTHAGFEYSIRPWGDRDFSGNLAPHGWFAAEYRNLLRNMMVREQGRTLHLLSAVSPEWVGAGKQIKVERAATYFGLASLHVQTPDDTSAIVEVSLDRSSAYAPEEVLIHLPWFVDQVSATSNGKPLKIVDGAIALPKTATKMEIHWHRKPLAADFPLSYTDAVERYKAEYRRRYILLTGDDTVQ